MSQSSIVILTDRPENGRRLQRDLSLVAATRVASPNRPLTEPVPLAVVSDLALDNADSVRIVRSARGAPGARAAPLVCILRSGSRREDIQARALGAGAVLPLDASRRALIEAVVGAMAEGEADAHAAARDGARDAGLALADIMDAIEDGAPIPLSRLPEGARHVAVAVQNGGLRAWLDVVWSFDDGTYQHVLLVAGLAAAFVDDLGFCRRDGQRITEAALLHDVGKVGVPREILNKAGALTPDETEAMRRHAQHGHAALIAAGGVCEEVLAAVRGHHEYLDGSGYPDGLAGAEICDAIRIVTICDIFAALVESRPYRAPMSPKDALGVMREMGGKLDGDILAAFERMIGRLDL